MRSLSASSADVASSSSSTCKKQTAVEGEVDCTLEVPIDPNLKCDCVQLVPASTHQPISSEPTFGFFRMARAMAMRCFCPPDICTPFSPTCVS